ncbi:TlpA disulfide reductase family protein [Chitinophaga varians]|uniref:TlpA disulfide reductase family protein n=1 Tax=Chitinophaga varians TaxID=2202339 RepID=UPI00165F6542|nr:TlpA disulfide reductase family protein [Chitinophaga varians]MBC9911820.1 AhpC/TSA family protein [Chitinophaga varians]
MTKTIIFGAALLSAISVQAQTFTLKGTLAKNTLAVNSYIYLRYEQQGKTVLDSCRLQQQAYHFQGTADYPKEATLFLKVSGKDAEYYRQTRLLKPYERNFYLDAANMTARADGELRETTITGGAAEADRQAIEAELSAIYQRGEKAYGAKREAAYKNKDSVAIAEVTRLSYKNDAEREAAKLRFMQEHPHTGMMLKLLNEYTRTKIDPTVIGPLYEGMLPSLKASPEGVAYGQRLAKAREIAPGMPAPAVALKDRQDNLITLASLKGKVVLLDFWGSWCYPCRMSHPHLREAYARYKDAGFEILGVSNERGDAAKWKESWTKAMDADQMTWLNVLNTAASTDKDKGVLDAYDVKAFPTKILIDREGRIVVKLVGNSESSREALDTALERLLGKGK